MHPITLGKKTFKSNVFYAPLAGCSDYPYRQMARRYSPPGLVFCEMLKMEALMRGDKNSFRLLDSSSDMHPIGAQLCGSNLDLAAPAARIIEDLGFDILDLNCGCPVDKVTKDGSGSGLLKEPNKIGDLIHKMVGAVSIPVTIKIRVGWDLDQIVAPQLTEIAQEAGAVAIFIHGRTRVQAYKGVANWDYIKDCKARAKSIRVFGNGDLFTAQNAMDMFEQTDCDGVLISRGTFGQPWIAEDIHRMQEGLSAIQRDFDFCKQALLDHFHIIKKYAPTKKAILDMRRVGCWYFKKGDAGRAFRKAISRVKTLDEVEELVLNLSQEVSPVS